MSDLSYVCGTAQLFVLAKKCTATPHFLLHKSQVILSHLCPGAVIDENTVGWHLLFMDMMNMTALAIGNPGHLPNSVCVALPRMFRYQSVKVLDG